MEKLSLPYSLETEISVLGGILIEPEIFTQVADQVLPSDFYLLSHQILFEEMLRLHRSHKPTDLITLTNALKEKGHFDKIGGNEYLVKLLQDSISNARIESYCQILREKSMQRAIIQSSKEIQEKSLKTEFNSVDELLAFAMKEFQLIESQRSKKNTLVEMFDIVGEVIPEIERRASLGDSVIGLSSGFPSLDYLTQGFKKAELIVVAARPSMGKTAISLNLAYSIAVKQRLKVAYFSIEMPKETLVLRMLASSCKIDLERMQAGKIKDHEWSILVKNATELSEAQFFIDDSNPLSPNELRARCRHLKNTKGLDCVIVDYLQLMRGNGKIESREREVAEISQTLKGLAKELKIPVIALAQLNREADKRDGHRPVISDLRDSGSIEMDADVICLLFREDYYDRDDERIRGNSEIIVGKNRNGKTGVAKLKFNAEWNRFEERS